MEYDYGASREFTIELVSVTEMKRGAGRGIIEDTSPYELADMIEETDKTGKPPMIYDYEKNKEMEWDYRNFILKYCNVFLKDEIYKIQCAYECY